MACGAHIEGDAALCASCILRQHKPETPRETKWAEGIGLVLFALIFAIALYARAN